MQLINCPSESYVFRSTKANFNSSPVSVIHQSGAALIITLVVMLVLTIIAVASTNSNQTQAMMVRNNQFRLETFNTSYAEIDAQVDFVNKRKISDGIPDHVITLIDGVTNQKVWHGAAGDGQSERELALLVPTNASELEREITQWYSGVCLVFGEQLGAGIEKIACDEIKIDSDTALMNTRVSSNQFQVYRYKSLKQ